MFTIEHEFDATVVTLVDEGDVNLKQDVIVSAFEECVTLTQFCTTTHTDQRITLSIAQLNDLIAALNLPEGAYRRK